MYKLFVILAGSIIRFWICGFCVWLMGRGILDKMPSVEMISAAAKEATGWLGGGTIIAFSVWRTYLLKKSHPEGPTYPKIAVQPPPQKDK